MAAAFEVQLTDEQKSARFTADSESLRRSRQAARSRPYHRSRNGPAGGALHGATMVDDGQEIDRESEGDIPIAAGTVLVRVHELDDVPVPEDVVGNASGTARLTRARRLRPSVRVFANPRPMLQKGQEDACSEPVRSVTVAPDGKTFDAAWDPGAKNSLRVPFDALALGMRFSVVDASGMGSKGGAPSEIAGADLDIASCLRHAASAPWRRRLLLLDGDGADCGEICVVVQCEDVVYGDEAKRVSVAAHATKAPPARADGHIRRGGAPSRGRGDGSDEDEDEDEEDLLHFVLPPPPPARSTAARRGHPSPPRRGGAPGSPLGASRIVESKFEDGSGGEGDADDPWADGGGGGGPGDEALPDTAAGPDSGGGGKSGRLGRSGGGVTFGEAALAGKSTTGIVEPPPARWASSVPGGRRREALIRQQQRRRRERRRAEVAAVAQSAGASSASFVLSQQETRVTKDALRTLGKAAEEERRAERWHDAQRREVARRARKQWEELQRQRRQRQADREEVEAALLVQQAEALVAYDRKITRVRRAKELALEKKMARPLLAFQKTLKGPYFGDGPPPAEPWEPAPPPSTVAWDQNGRRQRVAADDMPDAEGSDPTSRVIAHVRRLASGRGRMDLRRPFRRWDADQSGTLSPDEFERALASVGVRLERHELDHVVRAFDTDGDGSVSYGEFLVSVFNRRKLRAEWGKRMQALEGVGMDAARAAGRAVARGAAEEGGTAKVRGLLRAQDGSGRGRVHRRKVARVLRELGIEMPEWQLQTLLDRYAAPGGTVDYGPLLDFLDGDADGDADGARADAFDRAEEREEEQRLAREEEDRARAERLETTTKRMGSAMRDIDSLLATQSRVSRKLRRYYDAEAGHA